MPELPEVETIRRDLADIMRGKRLKSLTLRRKDLRAPFPKNMASDLEGQRVEELERRAKYLLIHFSGGKTLLIHLGMSGSITVANGEAPAKHDHVIFELEDGTRLYFRDPRRFGRMDVFDSKVAAQHPLLKNIGIEPLSKKLNATLLEKLFKGKKIAIKLALMDQRLIAGIGNIYASEALFYASINPRKAAGKCGHAELAKLAPAIRKVLQKAIAAGGSTLRDHARPSGAAGNFQNGFAVYDRNGKPCPGCTCDIQKTGGVQCVTLGGRSTYFCPVKQK